MRTVRATRYVTPLREGGSVPAIVELETGELSVMKLRGAGQGARALVAEIIVGQLGRALGLPVPELVLVPDVPPVPVLVWLVVLVVRVTPVQHSSICVWKMSYWKPWVQVSSSN